MEMLLLLFTLIGIFGYGESANVLVVVPFTSRSHYIFLRPIGLELARRGHNVTVITAFKETGHPPSYHEVMVEKKEIWELSEQSEERPNVFTMVDMSSEEFTEKILWNGGLAFTEHAVKSPEVQKFLNEDHTFDVVIAEQFYSEAMYILAHKYQAPLILATTFGNCMRHNIITKNPLQLATVLSEFLTVENPTSFWGRFRNWYFSVYEYVNFKFWYIGRQEELVQKYIPKLPEPVPSLIEMQKNASLTLYNSHFSFDPPAAYLPNILEIGGLHLTMSDGNLPKDLQKILDDASQGVVYVNFGSNVRSSELPDIKRDALINVFRKLKQTVFWKWEDENLKNLPKNVVMRKWLPQKEIFAHPNIRVFISHGGLIGTHEAIFHGVPIIGVPIYADQYNNLLQIQYHGMGKVLKYHDIDEKTLGNMLHDVLTNDSYRIKAKELSRRFQDRPMTALDTAMFWIEYVIRNKGAEFMKNPARNLHWIESSMLDVYIVVVVVPITALLLLIVAIRTLLKTTFSGTTTYKSDKKKKN